MFTSVSFFSETLYFAFPGSTFIACDLNYIAILLLHFTVDHVKYMFAT